MVKGSPGCRAVDEQAVALECRGGPANHVLQVGYGAGGKRVADTLRKLRVGLIVVEVEPGRVAQAKAAGHVVVQGDARCSEVLIAANAPLCSFVAITVGDPDEGLVHAVRRVKPVGIILTHIPKGFMEPGMRDATAAMLARVIRLLGRAEAAQIPVA